jgi:hypothetical protein
MLQDDQQQRSDHEREYGRENSPIAEGLRYPLEHRDRPVEFIVITMKHGHAGLAWSGRDDRSSIAASPAFGDYKGITAQRAKG